MRMTASRVVRVNVFPVLKDGDFSSESPTLQAST
jgi:hypothetical protein